MKSKRIYKEYTHHLFNPLTNDIEFDRAITVNREMTTAEKKKYYHCRGLEIFWSVLSITLIAMSITLIVLAGEGWLSQWFYFSILLIFVAAFPIKFGIEHSVKCDDLLNREFPAVGFEEYDRTHEDSEEYQQDCAEIWRATHPLEEKIRRAQQSGNCVDIADLVRHCETHLVDKINYQ